MTGIIFDLDGTLIDSNKAYQESLEEIGIDADGDAYRSARDDVKRALGAGNPGARNRLLYFKRMLESQGHFSASKLLTLMDSYESELTRRFSAQWQALGRERLLAAIAAKHPCVLLTNENTRTQLLKARAIDPAAKLFRRVITSEEVGVEKPDRRMFQAAFDALNLSPENCVVVGDDLVADITPAIAFGASAIWTTEFHNEKKLSQPPKGCKRIDRLDELTAVLPGAHK